MPRECLLMTSSQPRESTRWRWEDFLFVLFPVLISLAVASPHLVGILEDELIYLNLVETLFSDTGKVVLLPGEPYVAKYPLGYPLILFFGAKLFAPLGLGVAWSYLLTQVVLTGFLAHTLLNVWSKKIELSLLARAFSGLVLFANYSVMMVFAAIMSETAYMIVAAWALYLTCHIKPLGKKRVYDVGTALLLCFSQMIRSVGITVFIAGIAGFIVEKRGKLFVFTLLLALIFAGAGKLIQVGVNEKNQTQLGQKSDYLGYYISYDYNFKIYKNALKEHGPGHAFILVMNVAGANCLNGAASLLQILFPTDVDSAEELGKLDRLTGVGAVVFALAILVVVCMGLSRDRTGQLLLLVLFLGILLQLVWTWPFTSRFWIPLLPILILGLARFCGKYGRMGNWIFAAICASSFLLNFPHLVGRVSAARSGQEFIVEAGENDPPLIHAYVGHLQWLKQRVKEENQPLILVGGLNTMMKAYHLGAQGIWMNTLVDDDLFLKSQIGLKLSNEDYQKKEGNLKEQLVGFSNAFGHESRIYVISDFSMNESFRSNLRGMADQGIFEKVFSGTDGLIEIYEIIPSRNQ